MLALNLGIALAPSVAILWWAYRRDAAKKETVRLLATAFILGLLAVAPAIAIGILAGVPRAFLDGYPALLFEAFVVAALVEESVKLGLLTLFIRRHREFDETTDGIVYGMAGSLGFAFLENVLYVGGPSSVLLLRGVTAVPLHAGCGALIGYFVATAHFDGRSSPAVGLAAAVGVHGLYNALIFAPGWISYGALVVVAGLVAGVPRLFRHATKLDRAAGRIGPP